MSTPPEGMLRMHGNQLQYQSVYNTHGRRLCPCTKRAPPQRRAGMGGGVLQRVAMTWCVCCKSSVGRLVYMCVGCNDEIACTDMHADAHTPKLVLNTSDLDRQTITPAAVVPSAVGGCAAGAHRPERTSHSTLASLSTPQRCSTLPHAQPPPPEHSLLWACHAHA